MTADHVISEIVSVGDTVQLNGYVYLAVLVTEDQIVLENTDEGAR